MYSSFLVCQTVPLLTLCARGLLVPPHLVVPPSLETREAYDEGTAKGFGAMLPTSGFLWPVQHTFKSNDRCKNFTM